MPVPTPLNCPFPRWCPPYSPASRSGWLPCPPPGCRSQSRETGMVPVSSRPFNGGSSLSAQLPDPDAQRKCPVTHECDVQKGTIVKIGRAWPSEPKHRAKTGGHSLLAYSLPCHVLRVRHRHHDRRERVWTNGVPAAGLSAVRRGAASTDAARGRHRLSAGDRHRSVLRRDRPLLVPTVLPPASGRSHAVPVAWRGRLGLAAPGPLGRAWRTRW